MSRRRSAALAIALAAVSITLTSSWLETVARAEGIVPRARSYDYVRLTDSTSVSIEFLAEFADSTLYENVDSNVVRLEDVVVGQWSRSYEDSLTQWFRNTTPLDPVQNEIQFVGFDRPGLRVVYDPPLTWVPPVADRSVGFTWSWTGGIQPDPVPALPDTIYFRVEAVEDVALFDGRVVPAWKIVQSATPPLITARGLAVDLTGQALFPRAFLARRFEPVSLWYASIADGGPHLLLVRSDRLILDPSTVVEARKASVGRLRSSYRPRSN